MVFRISHTVPYALGVASLLAVTQASADPSPPPPTSSGVTFQFDETIPSAQSDQLKADLSYLASHPLTQFEPKLLTILGLKDASTASLSAWLSARVHFIVAQNFDPDKNTQILQKNYAYPNPNVFPIELAPDPLTQMSESADSSSGGVSVIMLNIGGGLYLEAKEQSVLVSESIPGLASVKLTSPRVGIIQIGDGMFSAFQSDPQNQIDDQYGSISRLAVLFHEARHSDGNGQSAIFPHSICPAGHDYAGNAACDDSLNGAYYVGALIQQSFTESCKTCTAADLEALRLGYLDSYDRVLTSAPSNEAESDIIQFQSLVSGCDAQSRLGVTQDAHCDQYRSILADLNDEKNFVPATALDPTPEGEF